MTASTVSGSVAFVPAQRAALPVIPVPAPRTPVDRVEPCPAPSGRHRATASAPNAPARTRRVGPARAVTLTARVGSVVTLAAMLVMAAAAAGLSDGQAPTGDAAAVATTTLH